MPDADLNAVAVFAAVVETGSFRGAAQALRAPRSTVSLKVAQLEDRLGARLLERTTRSVRLTDAGALYHQEVVPALEALRAAEQRLSAREVQPAGRLRLSAPEDFGESALAPALAEYLTRYPGVEVDVELTSRRVDLLGEGFDLAIRAGPLTDSTLVAKKIGRPQRVLLHASPGYVARRGAPRRVDDLVHHDCLVIADRPATWPLRRRGRVVAVPVHTRTTANTQAMLHALAVAGLGIARLPEHLGAAAVRSGALRTFLDDAAPPANQLHAVYPSARHLPAKVRGLLALLEERLVSFPQIA